MKTAKEVMSRNLISVTPTASITEATRTLEENGISGCPVIDFNGVLRGILSKTDVLRAALQSEPEARHTVLRLMIPGTSREDDVYAPGNDLSTMPQVQDVMCADCISVGPETPVSEIAALMSEERIHRVPVVEDTRVVGIITSLDLLGAFPTAANSAAAG